MDGRIGDKLEDTGKDALIIGGNMEGCITDM